jgi:hypothetical protein
MQRLIRVALLRMTLPIITDFIHERLLITFKKDIHVCNATFINFESKVIMSKVFISIVVVSCFTHKDENRLKMLVKHKAL